MGHLLSTAEDAMAEKYDPSEPVDPTTNGYVLSGCLVSTEILAAVLAFVPKDQIVRTCRVVCKNWKYLIDDHVIWSRMCERLRIPVPRLKQELPPHFYRQLAFKDPYGRNLVRNPCGREGTRHWQIELGGGQGWEVEDPPKGVDSLSEIGELNGVTSAFATSYGECRKHQLVDLYAEGCLAEVLDELQPPLYVSEWHAARFDCACRYLMTVRLMNASRKVIDEFTQGPVDEEQWVGKCWHKVEHCFHDYGAGLRYVVFIHMGHDLQFWAGHYGSKMTAATVRFQLKNK